MLDFELILKEFSPVEQQFKRNILREYLQYKLLDIIYKSKFAGSLVFLGGTALRIVHGNTRFSEDLGFDNLGLNEADFVKLSDFIKYELELEGYEIEMKQVFKGAYHCNIKFPDLLYREKLSPVKSEKILIQLDTEPQNYKYEQEKFLLKKFALFRFISVVPASTLLSQKIAALLGRKRSKGRDYFDVTFLLSKTTPDFKYLSEKLKITGMTHLKQKLLENIESVNLKELAIDVSPFLIKNDQIDRVLMFREFVESLG